MERDMKRTIIQYTTVVLAFLAGMIFMTYMTRMGNRDMTGDMAQAQLPVVYAEQDGVLYNEMHGYVEDMDGASMRDSVIGVSEDHKVGLALEKYNAQNRKDETDQKIGSSNLKRYYDGGSPSDIWAVRSAGIDPVTGREIFIKKDGTQTFEFDYNDEVIVGNSDPKLEGVIGSSFYWKGLSASINFRYRVGGQIFLSALYNKVENISDQDVYYNQDKRALYDRWQKPGDVAKFKAISLNETTPMSSRFVADENTLSCESVSIGYETQARWLRHFGASSMTIRGYMNDIFRISTVKNERGLDYPFARSVAFSLGIRF